MAEFTHLDARGRVRMVEVTEKAVTVREGVARGRVRMQPETLARILSDGFAKGEVLAVARTAAIMAAKETPRLIPLCHPLMLTSVNIAFNVPGPAGVLEVEARVKTTGQTGVEMEALTAVSVAALTIYDMCKAVDRGMVIGDIRLVEKSGGRSGHFVREDETKWRKPL